MDPTAKAGDEEAPPLQPEDAPAPAIHSILAVACFGAILLIGAADWLVGQTLSFSIFYLIPIALLGWRGSLVSGLAAAVFAGSLWFAADFTSHTYDHPAIGIWNALVRLSIFVAAVVVLNRHRQLLERERALAREDSLTGTKTSRAFYEHLDHELARARRSGRPLTVAFLDLDHFKSVNDSLGHPAGDQLLRTVGHLLRSEMRPTDIVGRLGGDEFGIILPELADAPARRVLERILAALEQALAEVDPAAGAIGVSFGAITCWAPEASPQELIKAADELMYRAKRAGGDRLIIERWPSAAPDEPS